MELPFGDDVAGRGVLLPGTVVDVVAVAVERYLPLNFNLAVRVAFADELDFADHAVGVAGFGVIGGFQLTKKNVLELRHFVATSSLFGLPRRRETGGQGKRDAAGGNSGFGKDAFH